MTSADQPVHGARAVRPDTDRRPLSELLDRVGRLEPGRASRIGLRLLDVLDAAHTKGITHGDLNPARLLLLPDDEIVLSGFGPTGTDPSRPVTDPAYASPEQARGDGGTPESDLWSLGAILFVMVEGHPPHPDWSGLDATKAGPLTQVIQGLLRTDPQARLTEPLVRQALARVVNHDQPADARTMVRIPWLHGTCEALWPRGHRREGRKARPRAALAAGLALVSVASLVALAASGALTTGDSRASGPTRSAAPPNGAQPMLPREPSPSKSSPTAPPSPTAPSSPSAPAEPSAPATPSDPPGTDGGGGGGDGEPTGFVRFTAEAEGFSIDLPKGWKRVASGSRFHVKFASEDEDDSRDLVVTFGKGSDDDDPVEVWKSLVPSLEKLSPGFQRVDDIRRVDYRDWKAADMTWSSAIGGDPFRTLGRGFLVGGGRGFSIRWTTPADEADSAENKKALDIILNSFEETKDSNGSRDSGDSKD